MSSAARLLSLIALVGAAAALPDAILNAIDDDAAITTLEKIIHGRFHSAARGRGETAARPPKQAHGPECASGGLTFVQTSVRFKRQLLDELEPTWRENSLHLMQVGRALVDAGVLPPCGLLARKGLRTVSNATCGAHWETKNPIPSRRRLDYASVAAVVNVGFCPSMLSKRADSALHVQKLLQGAARGETTPTLKQALHHHNEALEESCDYEKTALFALDDTEERSATPVVRRGYDRAAAAMAFQPIGWVIVIAIWLIIALSPLFVIVLAVWCCYCRNRKNNSIVVTTQQYIKKSRSSQARPVVEAAPVAKMV